MRFFLKTAHLFLLFLALMTLASCTCGDREERQAIAGILHMGAPVGWEARGGGGLVDHVGGE